MEQAINCSPGKRPPLEACIAAAEDVDLTAPSPETAHVYAKKKFGKNEFRPIAVFGIQHRTAQAMVKTVLDVVFKRRRFQFSNKGVAPAIAEARNQIGKGRHYYAHLDIKSYYTNFEASKLAANLPLPDWAVDHVLCGAKTKWEMMLNNPYWYISESHLIDQARQGIPQGSSSSPIVAMIECARLKPGSLGLTALINYMDDFLLLAKTSEKLEEQIVKLSDAVGALPGGHFTLVTKSSGHVSEGCVFLGHHVMLADGVVRIRPTDANLGKLLANLVEIQEDCGVYSKGTSQGPITPEERVIILQGIADYISYLESWESAFSECDDLSELWLDEYKQEISLMKAKVKATDAELAGYVGTKKFSGLDLYRHDAE